MVKTLIIRFLYQNVLKRIFFLIDPETIHDFMTLTGRILGSNSFTRHITGLVFSYSNSALEQEVCGIKFRNPVGLAAGFDKDANLTDILPSVGFGFMEVGTITGKPCKGNPKPHLWRLNKDQSLRVNLGLNNKGAKEISNRLTGKKFEIPLITSIGKTNSRQTIETEAGIADYVKAYKEFTQIGDFFDINISCPNAYGVQSFSDPKKLDKLLTEIDKIPTKKPVFLKMPPDLSEKELDQILAVAKKHKIAGFVCSNLLKSTKGGVSGKAVENLANKQIQMIYKKTQGKYIIIGCGGIFSAEDAYKKIKLGASLVQLITGMIFEGPQVISEINRGLVKLLQNDGYKNISEAIGKTSILTRRK